MGSVRFDVRLDITGCCGLEGPIEAAATVVLPSERSDGPTTVVFGFPGAGCSRGYFDVHLPGVEGYSQADHHAERGWIFVACDHLGVGDSTLFDPELLSFEVLAAADDALARAVVAGLRAGTLLEAVDPIEVDRTIGLGHSMGGCLVIVTQGLHHTFDAIGVLGFSAIHTVLPSPDGVVDIAPVDRDEQHLVAASAGAALGESVPFSWVFHWEDVPVTIVEQDIGEGFPLRVGTVPPWGSATIPPAAITMLTEGVVAAEAGSIEAPVFVGVGQRDVVPTPEQEPGAFPASRQVTVAVIPEMAHMHNFAGTRARLWDQLYEWGGTIPPR
jgi:pimeloyl-ACP methyl ester carboxylesterase